MRLASHSVTFRHDADPGGGRGGGAAAQVSTSEREQEYTAAARVKEQRIRAQLELDGLAPLFGGMERCPIAKGYRAQAIFRVEASAAGPRLFGVDPRHGNRPFSQTLWVLPDYARAIVRAVAGVLARERTLKEISAFELHLEYGSQRAHLNLAAPRAAASALEPVCRTLLEEIPELLGVSVPSRTIDLGEVHLRNQLHGRTVLAHYRAFFQSNLRLVPLLVDQVQASVDRPAAIVDLYCGVGLHSILAAAPGSHIVGADINPWAIQSAERNAVLHGLDHAHYHRMSAREFAARPTLDAPDIVFINPSRDGCEPGVPDAVARWQPQRICLISCTLESHLRDLIAFTAAGYRPLGMRSFDMFPFSRYVESVSVLEPG